MSLLTGIQSEYYPYVSNPSYTAHQCVMCDISKDNDVSHMVTSITTTTAASVTFKRNISLQPVYVKVVDGVEQLVYNSEIMQLDKQYRITWNDEEFIIIKNNDDNVDFYKFVAGKQ